MNLPDTTISNSMHAKKTVVMNKVVIAVICMQGFVFGASALAQTTQSGSLVQTVQIKPERAEEIAIAQAGGGTVMEIELKRKNHSPQVFYDIEIRHDRRKYEIKIDAETGEVVKSKSK
ncbi:MAG: PepSY domain-containing protein [Betaproteobacteria bacterium]|nr:PepSY domain-containing protein [Betaproteobacteria bacterium]